MNYWITTHWPPRIGDNGTDTYVRVAEGREQAADDMRQGDRVAIYEAKSDPREVDTLPNGSTRKIPRKPGKGGMICYGTVDSAILYDPHCKPTNYVRRKKTRWCWYAPVTVKSRKGFVNRQDINKIIGYELAYSLHGIGVEHSGLKNITEAEFNQLVKAFHN